MAALLRYSPGAKPGVPLKRKLIDVDSEVHKCAKQDMHPLHFEFKKIMLYYKVGNLSKEKCSNEPTNK